MSVSWGSWQRLECAPSQVCAEEEIQGLGLTIAGLLTHSWESVPKASTATVLRGRQCPRKVCGACSSLTKTEWEMPLWRWAPALTGGIGQCP